METTPAPPDDGLVAPSPVTTEPAPSEQEIEAFQTATRDLIGIALRSLDALEGEVTLPQFRLMLALNDLGPTSCSRAAHALDLSASAVTRLADRLHASGHLSRERDRAKRSQVDLELTDHGRHLVGQVLDRRHDELSRVLDQLEPGERRATAAGLTRAHAVVLAESYPVDLQGPVPL